MSISTLRTQLEAISAKFASEILAAVQGASLQEIIAGGGISTGNRKAPRKAAGGGGMPVPLAARKRERSGRLSRRSDEEIQATLNKVVLLVKTHKEGMRAEDIRSKLGMQAKEMPRILKVGVATKKLTSRGQKRATTYFAK